MLAENHAMLEKIDDIWDQAIILLAHLLPAKTINQYMQHQLASFAAMAKTNGFPHGKVCLRAQFHRFADPIKTERIFTQPGRLMYIRAMYIQFLTFLRSCQRQYICTALRIKLITSLHSAPDKLKFQISSTVEYKSLLLAHLRQGQTAMVQCPLAAAINPRPVQQITLRSLFFYGLTKKNRHLFTQLPLLI